MKKFGLDFIALMAVTWHVACQVTLHARIAALGVVGNGDALLRQSELRSRIDARVPRIQRCWRQMARTEIFHRVEEK